MSLLSQSWVETTDNVKSKKGSKLQHGQPCYRILPSKLFVLEKGPKWLWVMTCKVPKSALVKRREKNDLLMHATTSVVFSLFYLSFYHFLSFFLSLSSFTLSFMLFSHCEFLLFHLWLPLPFIVNWSMRFLLFVPKISPTTFGFLWAFLRIAH